MTRRLSHIAASRKLAAAVDRPMVSRQSLESLEDRKLFAAHVLGNATLYSTIQSAVDAAPAGGVVTVDAGTYAETVYVTKSLTLRGARSGIDARSNGRISGGTAGESIVTGAASGTTRYAAFNIMANNVVLDGFTVQGETSQDTATGAGIVIRPNFFGAQILNNVVQNNVAGLFLANNSSSVPAIIRGNVFRANNNAGVNGGRAIYTDGGISGGLVQNVTIDNNAFINNRGSSGTTGLEAAIAFEAKSAGKQTNIRITNNVFDGNGKATLFFHTTNVTLTGNFVTYTLDRYSGTFRFEGNVQNVSIQNNTLYNNTGPAVAIDSKGQPGNNSGFVITGNNIYGNSTGWTNSHLGVISDASTYVGTIDDRYNFWGAASGPGGDGPGTGDWVYGIGHVVSGNQWSFTKGGKELFSPWSTTPIGPSHGAYWGLAADTGVIIQAEDYDHGGEGYGYHDTTAGNAGKVYRLSPNEGADIQASTDTGGGYNIYNTAAGEWLTYQVNVPQTGTYRADFRIASAAAGGKFHLEVDGVNVTGSITVPNTGGTQKWATISANTTSITAGTHDVRLVIETNNAANFNYFSLNLASAAATPAAPSTLNATATSAAAIALTWKDNSSNETGFKVQRQIGTSGTWTTLTTTAAGVTSYSDTAVSPNSTYTYRIIATNASGDSLPSNTDTVTTPALAAAPTGVTAAATSSTQVVVDWNDASIGVSTGFKIERSTNGGAFTQIAAVGASVTEYTDTGVTAGTTYTYRVLATSAGGDSVYSATATATTPAANAVTTFLSNLAWTSATSGWNSAQLDESVAGNPLKIRGVTYAKGLGTHAVSQIVYDLSGGGYTTFLATVGVDDGVKGVGSVIFQVVGDGKTLFNSGVVTNNSAALNVNVDVTGVKTLTLIATNGVAGSIDYDHADWANARLLSAAKLPAAPAALQTAAVSSGQINLSWNESDASVSGFTIERSTNGQNFTPIAKVAGNLRTFADIGLAAATTYTYRVLATNSAGDSGYSSTSAGTTLTAAAATYLSDLQWVSATSGWSTVQLDKSISGNVLTIGTTTYTKGLGTHADSTIVYNLSAGSYTRFLADIGMDARVIGRDAAVRFQVIGDGKVLYDSGVVTDSDAARSIDVNVTDVKQLSLVVTGAIAGTIDYDHADWADARLV